MSKDILIKALSIVVCLCLGLVIGSFIFDGKFEAEVAEDTTEKTSKQEEVIVNTREPSTQLIDSINAYLTENGISQEQIGISIRSLDGIEAYEINGDVEFTAASVYKLPLAMIWYEKVNNGEITLQDTLYYDPAYYESGAGVADEYAAGSNITLETLLNSLIIKSDNTAGHILFENLGGWTNFKQEATKYTSRQMDDEFYSYENVLTPNYTGDVLQYLYDHKDSFSTLIENMKNAMPNNYLDLRINTHAAQKYGSFDYAENVAGFVEEVNIPYSIAIFTTLGTNGVNVIGDINQICFEYFANEHA